MSGVPLNNLTHRVNRTCEGCRRRKIRCTRDSESATCERCTKLGLDCLFSAPATRKRRQRNEAQIRELEEKLDRVWELVLADQKPSSSAAGPGSISESSQFADLGALRCYKETPSPFHGLCASATQSGLYIQHDPQSPNADSIVPSLVHEVQALELWTRFCNEALPFYPFVFIPNPSSVQFLQQSRPALFRAVLAAAASCFQPELSPSLYREAEKYISEQAIVNGQKSLDLVQGALILALWSRAPKHFKALNFGQFANLAASMVLDMRSSNEEKQQISGPGSVESRLEVARTYAATYVLCSSIAMSYSRPTILRCGPWVETCIQMLISSTISEGDFRLAAWTQLQRLAERGFQMAGLDDGTIEDTDNSRLSTILGLSFDQVRHWRQTIPSNTINSTLSIHYQVVLLNLSVPGLRQIHDSKDFRAPFAIRSSTSYPFGPRPSHISSVEFLGSRNTCLTVAKDILNLFLSLSVHDLQKIPAVVYTRVMYASVVIMKLDVCNQPASGNMQRDLSNAIEALSLLETVVSRLAQATDNGRFDVPSTFHSALKRMVCWCQEAFVSLDETYEGLIEPLKDLKRSEAGELPAAPPLDTSGDKGLGYPDVFDVGATQVIGSQIFEDSGTAGLIGYTDTILTTIGGDMPWESS